MTATDLRTASRIVRDHLHGYCSTASDPGSCTDGCEQATRDLVCELRNASVALPHGPVEVAAAVRTATALLRFLLDDVSPENGTSLVANATERMALCRALAARAAAELSGA